MSLNVSSIDMREIKRVTRQIMSNSSSSNGSSSTLLNEENLSKFKRGTLSKEDVECLKVSRITKLSECYNKLIQLLCSLKVHEPKNEKIEGYRLDFFA